MRLVRLLSKLLLLFVIFIISPVFAEEPADLPENELKGIWEIQKTTSYGGKHFIFPETKSKLDLNSDGIPDIEVGKHRLFFRFDGSNFSRISKFEDSVKFIGKFKGNGYSESEFLSSWLKSKYKYSYKNKQLSVDNRKFKIMIFSDGRTLITTLSNEPIAKMIKVESYEMGNAKTPVWKKPKSQSSIAANIPTPVEENYTQVASSGNTGKISPSSPWSDSDWQ